MYHVCHNSQRTSIFIIKISFLTFTMLIRKAPALIKEWPLSVSSREGCKLTILDGDFWLEQLGALGSGQVFCDQLQIF